MCISAILHGEMGDGMVLVETRGEPGENKKRERERVLSWDRVTKAQPGHKRDSEFIEGPRAIRLWLVPHKAYWVQEMDRDRDAGHGGVALRLSGGFVSVPSACGSNWIVEEGGREGFGAGRIDG
jgi:hypothetical protein